MPITKQQFEQLEPDIKQQIMFMPLSLCLFTVCAENIIWNSIVGRNITNQVYADNTTLMTERAVIYTALMMTNLDSVKETETSFNDKELYSQKAMIFF